MGLKVKPTDPELWKECAVKGGSDGDPSVSFILTVFLDKCSKTKTWEAVVGPKLFLKQWS